MDYDHIHGLMCEGTRSDWESIAHAHPSFPNGVDDFVQRRCIINAIDSGPKECVQWMLEKGVDLNFVDEEGRTPLLACLDREFAYLSNRDVGQDLAERLEILELLIDAGADINLRGFNGWTPLHMAAARNELEAVHILLNRGADRSIRTDCDEDFDPAEEAESLGRHEAALLIRTYRRP